MQLGFEGLSSTPKNKLVNDNVSVSTAADDAIVPIKLLYNDSHLRGMLARASMLGYDPDKSEAATAGAKIGTDLTELYRSDENIITRCKCGGWVSGAVRI